MVVSDHSPVAGEREGRRRRLRGLGRDRRRPVDDGLLLTEASRRAGSGSSGSASSSPAPRARRFVLPGKGRVAPGFDADLALVDLDDTRTLTDGELRQRHSYSPFTGRTLRAHVIRTILRGQTISRVGRPAVSKPIGRMIDRARSAPLRPRVAAA